MLVPPFYGWGLRYGEVKQFDQGHTIGQGWSREEKKGFFSLVPPIGYSERCSLIKKKKEDFGGTWKWDHTLRSGK